MTHLLDYLADRVLLADGPVGTQVQARNLDTERDFLGHENCTDVLCQSRPDLVREIHLAYLRAGCDAVQTNSFGGSPITLGEIVIETCQDPLQIKAAVNGAKCAREAAAKDIPIIVRVTVETTGTLLVGADIAAAATIIHALDVPIIGLNCATGPREMAEHVKWLGDNWPGL